MKNYLIDCSEMCDSELRVIIMMLIKIETRSCTPRGDSILPHINKKNMVRLSFPNDYNVLYSSAYKHREAVERVMHKYGMTDMISAYKNNMVSVVFDDLELVSFTEIYKVLCKCLNT